MHFWVEDRGYFDACVAESNIGLRFLLHITDNHSRHSEFEEEGGGVSSKHIVCFHLDHAAILLHFAEQIYMIFSPHTHLYNFAHFPRDWPSQPWLLSPIHIHLHRWDGTHSWKISSLLHITNLHLDHFMSIHVSKLISSSYKTTELPLFNW